MICPHCRHQLEESVSFFGGKWHGFTRCLKCTPSGAWMPRGEVGIIWPPLVPRTEEQPKT